MTGNIIKLTSNSNGGGHKLLTPRTEYRVEMD